MEFALIPGFLPPGASADYIVTGGLGEEAHSGCRVGGHREGVGPGCRLDERTPATAVVQPEEAKLDPNAAYVHHLNETIHGLQYLVLPEFGKRPQVCDMSSDFLWRKVDVSKLALAFGGAQKNIGRAG